MSAYAVFEGFYGCDIGRKSGMKKPLKPCNTSSFNGLVVLSGHNSNNYTTLITHKRKLCQESALGACIAPKDRESQQINEYGETEIQCISVQQKRLSDSEIQEIIEAYKAGANCCELGKKYGCHHTTISGTLKKAGITVRNGSTKVLDEATIISMYEIGQTMSEIAKRFDIDPHTVSRCLKKNRILIRNTNDYRWKQS